MGLRLILLGPPGSGKGTQATFIVERYGVSHISSGDLFRHHVQSRTPIGLHLEPYLARGDLVPDEIVFEMLAESIAGACESRGFLLDGFPRTLAQAERIKVLTESYGCALHAVVALHAPVEVLTSRLLLRGVESGRPDDTADVIRHRLEVYEEVTSPLIEYYERLGLLRSTDASLPAHEIRSSLFEWLDDLAIAAGDPAP